MKKMRWMNLKDNKCPRCGKDWAFDLTVADEFLTHGCGFKIRESRCKEIINGMINRDAKDRSLKAGES